VIAEWFHETPGKRDTGAFAIAFPPVQRVRAGSFTFPDDQGQGGSALAISKDGVHWTKPDLGQVSINGSKQNNRLAIPPRADGTAHAGILDETGEPIPGYSLSNAVALTGDKMRQRVAWNKSRSLSKLAGRTVRLKFHLRHANLYAFWTE